LDYNQAENSMLKFQPFNRMIGNSLRMKVTLGVVLPLVVILGIFTLLEYFRHRQVVLTNLSLLSAQSGRVVENNLRHAMLKSDFSEVQSLLDTIGESEEFRVVYLLDTSGKVIFAPKDRGVGMQFDNRAPDCLPCHKLDPAQRPGSVIVTADDGQRVFRSMVPIENSPECSVCHGNQNRLIGLLLTDIPVAPMEAAMASDLRAVLVWWLVTIVITVIVVNLAMSRIVINRLGELAHAMRNFGHVQLNLDIIPHEQDEVGQLAQAFKDMGQRIELESAENRILSEDLLRQSQQRGELLKGLITAQEDERKRLARELHDDLGQALTALSLQVEVVEKLIDHDPAGAIDQLDQTRDLIHETTEHMYELILALRPSALDELGLAAALRAHAERFLNGSGIACRIEADGISQHRLPADIETALYRIFQEALNNVRKHAQARNVRISLAVEDSHFTGEIQDDGRGFTLDADLTDPDDIRGLGLMSIQERVHQCGGKLEIQSQPGQGTLIRVRFPISETDFG
jgi:signal transduction histidine kinase